MKNQNMEKRKEEDHARRDKRKKKFIIGLTIPPLHT
jgi:hypothetical protein